MQDGLSPADDDGVPRVMTALEARDGSDALGEEIDDLALALIASLRADDHEPFPHDGRVLSYFLPLWDIGHLPLTVYAVQRFVTPEFRGAPGLAGQGVDHAPAASS